MRAVIVTLLLGGAATAIPLLLAAGWSHARARQLLTEAKEKAMRGERRKAREGILIACRLRGDVKRDPAIRDFYEVLVGPADDAKVAEAAAGLSPMPESPWEKIYASPAFKMLVAALVALIVMWRLATLF